MNPAKYTVGDHVTINGELGIVVETHGYKCAVLFLSGQINWFDENILEGVK